MIRRLAHSDAPIRYKTLDYPDVAIRVPDIERARTELGFEPWVDLKEGLRRTVAWYRSHSDWVAKAKSGEYRTYYEKFYQNRRASLSQL